MNYLRAIHSSQTCRTLWVALRRSRLDVTASRSLVRMVAVSALLVSLYETFLQLMLRTRVAGVTTYIGVAAIGGMVLVCICASPRHLWEWRKLNRKNPAVPRELKLGIYRETCLLAALLIRLGKEIGMEEELPEGAAMTTRQVLLDRLAACDTREPWLLDLEPWLLNILLARDGPLAGRTEIQSPACMGVPRRIAVDAWPGRRAFPRGCT